MTDIGTTIEAFVLAHAAMQKIKGAFSASKVQIRERTQTNKQVLLENMLHRGLDCIEMRDPQTDTCMYIRLEHAAVGTRCYGSNDVISWMRELREESTEPDPETIIRHIESCSTPTQTKPTLKLSDKKPRNVSSSHPPADLKDIAADMITCRNEAKKIAQEEKAQLSSHSDVCEMHKATIIDYLAAKDPVHGVQRLSVPDDDGKMWTYFLRKVDVSRSTPIRGKQLVKLIEPLAKDIDSKALCEANSAYMRNLATRVHDRFVDFSRSTTQTKTELILQRGPPKQ